MFSTLIKSMLASAALWAATNTAMALTCTYVDDIRPANGVMPLQISAITVGRDVPVGTEVYRQKFKVASSQSPTVRCLYAPYQTLTEMNVNSNIGVTGWSSGKYANKVYRTGIEGLGVAFGSAGKTMPWKSSSAPAECRPGTICETSLAILTEFELVLIKMGDVRPGVLVGGNLPSVSTYAHFNAIRMLAFSMTISGSIQIVSRTCSTPDVAVPMGTHQTKEFTGLNSTTGWKDFSIVLNNCPAFHGTYSTNAPSWTSQSGDWPSGVGTGGSRTNNSLLFRIDPARLAINVPNGVLSLDPSPTGAPPAASGVGIQIATANNAPMPLGANQSSGLNLRTSEGSYSIPLRARYLQTGSQVTPGPANASATFTITYQ